MKYIQYIIDFIKYNKEAKKNNCPLAKWGGVYPCLKDKTSKIGFDGHYIYHPAWAARILSKTMPSKHIDISSTLIFSVIMSAFIPIEYYEYRPAPLKLSNMVSGEIDLLSLPFESESVSSLSCMHVIEHVGLGRYGDNVDAQGDLKAIIELKRVVKKGGCLLLVVPVGEERVEFNAHRIYSYDRIMGNFEQWKLRDFSLIPDDFQRVGLIQNATREEADSQRYACGCFCFQK